MSNRYCPCSTEYDPFGKPLPGPHDFNWSEGTLIYCSYCGESRLMDPDADIPEDDSYTLPDPGPPTGTANKPGNGIFNP